MKLGRIGHSFPQNSGTTRRRHPGK